MLDLQQIQRDRVGVAGFEQFELLVLEIGNPLALAGKLSTVGLVMASQLGVYLLPDLGNLSVGELNTRPPVGNGGLHVDDEHSRLIAGAPLRSSDAVEVRVSRTPAVGDVHDPNPASAVAAPQRPLEVVLVPLGLLAAQGTCGADGLNGLEGMDVDHGFVASGVPDAVVLDLADVVAVGQHLVDALGSDSPARSFAGCGEAQAASVELVFQLRHGPFAGGIGLEHPLDERCSLQIDFDGADLTPLVEDANVPVAQGREAVRAAYLGLLAHAVGDVFGQIVAEELGDSGEHPVDELAAGRVVDVLGS